MDRIIGLLRESTAALAALSVLDTLLAVAASALFASALFRLRWRRNPVWYVLTAALCAAFGLIPPPADETAALLWAAAGLALPFCCMALIFPPRGLWKAMLAAAGGVFSEALRFLILLVFFGFDQTDRDDALETVVGLFVDCAFFLAGYLLFVRGRRRGPPVPDVTKRGAALFLMIVVSTGIMITTLLVMGSSYSEERKAEFAFMLLNVPALTVTATFAFSIWRRMHGEAENYRRQLDLQIRQFAWMEQMAQDVRMFRHDFPKKLRPLIAYLNEDRPEEARRMLEQFGDFASNTEERFHTGNFRLDTVLFCEDQLARREGISIEVPFDTVFPAEGIDPDDIYTIFPNALDNAIEASRSAEGEKVITFRTHMDKKTVYVTIRNPMSGEVKLRGGIPETNKADKIAHGYGFRSIQKAASRYGRDNVSFTAGDGVFELQISLDYGAGRRA